VAENNSVSVGTWPIKSLLHLSSEHGTRSSRLSTVFFFVVPEDKVLKESNVRYNRNVLPSEPVRIHSTSFSLKLSDIMHGV
jgi:hypothetical protein